MAAVAEITGQHVIAMLSANHINPDLAAEIFILEQAPAHNSLRTQPDD